MSFHPQYVELDGGLLKSTLIHDARGSRPAYLGIGDWHFFVSVVEEDGGRLPLWDGTDYGAAILEAEHARHDFGIAEPVRDVAAGGPA